MKRKCIFGTSIGIVLLILVIVFQGQIGKTLADRRSSVLFGDEFDGNVLDLNKWDIFKGNPVVDKGWLVLPEADIQSKPMFGSGILQGVIESSDWKSQNQFSDSSFGFEVWSGNNNMCHYGNILKASGHLAILSSKPDTDGNCFGDPLYQIYLPIPNWETIKEGGTISFTLNWSPDSVMLRVRGGGEEIQTSYSGRAIPTVPLKIRLYSQPAETYKINYVRQYAYYAVFLPMTGQ